jgi:hypothetical protein
MRQHLGRLLGMATLALSVAVHAVSGPCGAARAGDSPGSGFHLIEAKKIWSFAPHNAFTDLIRFQDRWYCTFREASSHTSNDGKLRIISSSDGQSWNSSALIQTTLGDLRDPKFSITPAGQLMLSGGVRYNQPVGGHSFQPMTWLSDNGSSWDSGHSIGEPDMWIFAPTWRNGTAYGLGYEVTNTYPPHVYSTADGLQWNTHVPDVLPATGGPTEASIAFGADGAAHMLVRRDYATALLGKALAPYTDWTWQDLGVRAESPKLIELPDERLVAAVRMLNPMRASLALVDPVAGTLTETLELPYGRGDDDAYPGMVLKDGQLWVSYYSNQQGKCDIYLAIVSISPEPGTIVMFITGAMALLALLWKRTRRQGREASRAREGLR